METGEPGVKPPEPVIDVWRHQCLTHKVATSSCSVFLVNLCLLLVTNQVSSCKTGGIAKPNNKARDWYECLDSSLRIIYISVSVLEKPGRKVLMSPPRRDRLFCNNAYAVLTRETRTESRLRSRKKHWKSYWRKPMLRRRTKILGPKELARINVQDHTTQEDVFFDYDPSSAPSLLFHMTTTFNLNLTP